MIALTDLRRFVRSSETTDDDALLRQIEQAAVAHVQRITGGRYFGAAAAVTETVIGTGTSRLWLSEAASALPATVVERSGPGADELTITAANSDGYVLRSSNYALVRKSSGLWGARYEYEVTYTRGYASTGAGDEISIAAPEDVRQAVRFLATWWYEQRIPAALGTVAPEVEHHLRAILKNWMRRPWA